MNAPQRISAEETSSETQGQLVGAKRSKPSVAFTFIENFRSYDFCPVYFVLPRLTAPGSPRMSPPQRLSVVRSLCNNVGFFAFPS